ncbi:MAG: hypothetical protein AABW87_01580 [Nanoarchaeota archaeon]
MVLCPRCKSAKVQFVKKGEKIHQYVMKCSECGCEWQAGGPSVDKI